MSNTREKEDQYSDWENARNWLMHPDVTKMSAKVIEALFKVKKKRLNHAYPISIRPFNLR